MTHLPLRCVTLAWLLLRVAWAQAPSVATTSLSEGATEVPCYTPIRVTLRFSSEAETLDPITLHSRSVRLYPAGRPDEKVFADLSYQASQQLLTLTPRSLMQARTAYVFEITRDLIDSRGFAFLPFQLHFTTDACDLAPPGDLAPAPAAPTSTRLGHWTLRNHRDRVELRWTTETEFQSEAFLVERAVGDSAFRELAWLPAAGSSPEPTSYHWVDTLPPLGRSFYRLRLGAAGPPEVIGDTLTLYREGIRLPYNLLPTGASIKLDFFVQARSTFVLLIRNRSGEEVLRKAGFLPPGHSRQAIALTDVPSGDYAVLVKTPKQRLVKAIRVQ